MAGSPNPLNKPLLGSLIAYELCRLGKTQKEMSLYIGISPEYLSCVLNGKARPSITLLIKIASFLEIDSSLLINAYKKAEK